MTYGEMDIEDVLKYLKDRAEKTASDQEAYALYRAYYIVKDYAMQQQSKGKVLRVRRNGYTAEYGIVVKSSGTGITSDIISAKGNPSTGELYAAIEKVVHKAHCKQFE